MMQSDAEGLSHDLISSWGAGSWLSRSLGSIPVFGRSRGWAAMMDGQDQNTTWQQPTRYTWRNTTREENKARFQQRQLEEKEQKLVRMYESAQAQALKRVGGGAPTTAASQNPGKVRQMFEERRTRAGIDKSHPLRPLGRTGPGAGLHRVETYKATSVQGEGDGFLRKEVTLEVKQRTTQSNDLPTLTKTHRFETERIFRDHNLNEESLEDVTFPDISLDQLTLETVTSKLPNVGGALPSQRQAKLAESNNNTIVTRNGPKKPEDNGGAKTNGDARGKVSPVERGKATPPRAARAQAAAASPAASRPRAAASHTGSPAATPPTPAKARTPTATTPTRRPKSPAKTASAPSPRRMAAKAELQANVSDGEGEGEGERCRVCKRRFAPERLAKHQDICARAAAKKRKPYDAIKHRIAGTEVEPYVKVVKKAGKTQAAPRSGPVALKPNNWRKKHEDFINAIRAAKQVQAHIKKGGKLSDLPPPPPSDTSDYVTCPHCSRKFNQHAAERHIPKCATFQFNKKPQPSKKR